MSQRSVSPRASIFSWERRLREAWISRRLQQCACREKHQQRDPQSGIAAALQGPPGREIERERDDHQIAHVARPGRADIDAVEGVGGDAHDGRERGEQHELPCRLAHIGAGADGVDQRRTDQEKEERRRRAEQEAPAQHAPRRREETGAVARADGAAAVARPSRKKLPIRMKLCSTALAASATSPARAPWAVKKAKAVISAAVRIMMSRLIASMRTSRSRRSTFSVATVPPAKCQARPSPSASPTISASTEAIAAPATP